MLNQNLLLAGDDAYNLTRSLRFRSSASAYLNRTPASASNDNTWTWSSWIKRGELGYKNIYNTANSIGSNTTLGQFSFVNDNLYFFLYTASTIYCELFTTAVFRDPSSWYHVVLQYDDTQATSSNRVKIYVNGVQQTLTGSYPSQNFNGFFNTAQPHVIGRYAGSGSANYFDGYITEINFIDGQALTPSSFGQTSSSTGVWQPKKYTGTYGTNGFYLPFTDNASTTTLGNDFSGNGNNWTTNNISLTAGTTYDSMIDVPTLSALASNYCVLNPLKPLAAPAPTYADANLSVTVNSVTAAAATFAIPSSGKWFWTCEVSGLYAALGIANPSNTGGASGSNAYGVYANGANGLWYAIGSYGTASNAFNTAGDIALFALDVDNTKFWIGRNRGGTVTWVGNGDPSAGTSPTFSGAGGGGVYATSLNLSTNVWYPYAEAGATLVCNFNFGQRPFDTTPPTGFVALNTFNLPTPTIGATASTLANKYFDATLYTGNASSRTITNNGGLAPAFVWIKDRTQAYNNNLYDSVRGIYKELLSNATAAETNQTRTLIGFNSNGFALGDDGDNRGVNINGDSFVAWQWAGNGTGVTNTAGSITSQVSANTSAGFSVVTWTGNGSSGATVGHGLGVAPAMVIVKRRDAGSNWSVSSRSISASQILVLNSTAASATDPGPFASTYASSTVITLGSSTDTNASGGTFVAYCFSEIAGYSKFGSYTGNGSTDGPFVFTGFRPRYVLWKNASAVHGWYCYDTARQTYNAMVTYLSPNVSDAEGTNGGAMDILSNGFKVRNTGGDMNANGNTIIYMAFAENPFKYSLAR